MFTLEWPWVLSILPLPILIWYFLPPYHFQPGPALYIPFYASLNLAKQQNIKTASPIWWLATIIWLLLVLAATRPQLLGKPIDISISGRNLLLAVDISGSMQNRDYHFQGHRVSRLKIVQEVAGRFIQQRKGDRLGLILFGTRAYLRIPLTFDRTTVQSMLKEAEVGLAGQKTAIGDAIGIAIKRLLKEPKEQRVLILLTDGANTAGTLDPLDAAKLAQKTQVRTYTIGIGSGQVGISTPFGTLMQYSSDLDPETLKTIAKITGGRFFQATDTSELEAIYTELNSLEPIVHDTKRFRHKQDLFMWPAGIAIMLAFGLAILYIN